MYYIMYVYDLPLLTLKFEFLEFFQKPPGGWWTTARRHICLCLFLGPWTGTAWRHIPGYQATHGYNPNFLGFCWTAWPWWTTARRYKPLLARFWCFA